MDKLKGMFGKAVDKAEESAEAVAVKTASSLGASAETQETVKEKLHQAGRENAWLAARGIRDPAHFAVNRL